MTQSYTGGTPTEYPDRYDSISSATHIGPSSPPTLIIAAQNDHLVPPAGAYSFTEAAQAAGVDITTTRIPYADHVFDSTGVGSQIYLGITQAWLSEQGIIDSTD